MQPQEIFKSDFVLEKLAKLKAGTTTELYLQDTYTEYSETSVLTNPKIMVVKDLSLLMPDETGNHDLKNAITIYEAYHGLTPTEATDGRLWTYLSHVTFWSYMKKRWPIEKQPEEKKGEYIIEHWFLDGTGASNLARNGIALLWWGANVTYDEEREDPFELTREFFSMLDYTRTILTGTQGRSRIFTHAFLEFVIENKEMFQSFKESRVRFLMRKLNFTGGYKILPSLSKDEIKSLLSGYLPELEKIIG